MHPNNPPQRPTLDPLEPRTLLAAAPPAHVLTAYTDNRGRATLTFSAALNPATLTATSASLYSPGPDAKLGTADDVRLPTTVNYRKGVLTLSAGVKKNRPYRVLLNAKTIKDATGKALDGEFNGQGKASGNGAAGGNYSVITKAPKNVVYRFTVKTGVGVTSYLNVGLFKDTPLTLANFQHYADEGAWDTTFFHRSTRDTDPASLIQIIQAGGFNVTQGQIGSVHSHAGVPLELKHSNVKGTIAMARIGGAANTTTNTNGWFFNVNDNTSLDTAGGGYTAFGAVVDKPSQRALEAINNLTIRKGDPANPTSPFNQLPSLDPTGPIDTPADLATVSRVAMLMDQSAT